MKNQLTLSAFADFAEKQGDREYDYWNTRECACAQFSDYIGLERDSTGLPKIWDTSFTETANLLAARVRDFDALAKLIRMHIARHGE